MSSLLENELLFVVYSKRNVDRIGFNFSLIRSKSSELVQRRALPLTVLSVMPRVVDDRPNVLRLTELAL